MQFNHKYPNVKFGEHYEFEGSAVFLGIKSGKCAHCRQLTHWMEISFGCFCCSEECFRVMWTAYFTATGTRSKPHNDIHPKS